MAVLVNLPPLSRPRRCAKSIELSARRQDKSGSDKSAILERLLREVLAVAEFTQRTTMTKKETAKPQWLVVDGDGQVVGRLATQIAHVLMGKHKADYTPHVMSGDVVVVVNAHKVRFTGKPERHPDHPYFTVKMKSRVYQRYSGYPGGRKVFTAAQVWEKKPEMILREAVRRMLPKNRLGSVMLKNLRLYNTPTHEHQAQQPQEFPKHVLPS